MYNLRRPGLQIKQATEVLPTVGLRFCLLGGFRILSGEKSIAAEQIHLRKAQDLLKLLALAPDQRLHRDKLLEALWPDCAPQAAAHNLSQTLYTLRSKFHELDPSITLRFEDESLTVRCADGISTDVEDFENAARLALSWPVSSDNRTAALYQQAITGYAGDLLPAEDPADLFFQRREHLRQLYLDLLLRLADYHLGIQEYLPAIDTLNKALACDPCSETVHIRLVRAYALNGQRQAALRQYRTMEAALRRELDVEPEPESRLLREQILQGDLAARPFPSDWPVRPRHNLPAVISSLIGREDEAAKVRQLITANRLVTLTGAGGVGKTRLALWVAESLADEFPQGIVWVELASLSNPERVAGAILDALQLFERQNRNEVDRLVDFLGGQKLLLILDNCEHLIAGCVSVCAAILKACPQTHIVLTSRNRFNLPGEMIYSVPALAVPNPHQPISFEESPQCASIQLFIERAGSCAQDFRLTQTNIPAIAHICQYLEGIPLAIELAAARCRMMTAEQIADQLHDADRLLASDSLTTSSRQRTMRASIEWSYNLLPAKERTLLQRLSVFMGGWDLEAAIAVCAGEEIHPTEMLDLLGSLVDHSLVNTDTYSADTARYTMHEIVREYAHQRLVESHLESSVNLHHLNYFRRLAEQADREIRGPRQEVWIKRLENEAGNIHSALERSFSDPVYGDAGIEMACGLAWYWKITGGTVLQSHFLKKALSRSFDVSNQTTRARVLFAAVTASAWGGHLLTPLEMKASIKESLEIWRSLGQGYELEQAQCNLALGFLQTEYFKDNHGLDRMMDSLGIFQRSGSTWWQAWGLNLISMLREEKQDDFQKVEAILQEDLLLWKMTGDRWGEALLLRAWGQYLLAHDEFAEAQRILSQSLEISQKLGTKGDFYQIIRDLGFAARALKRFEQAEAYLEKGVILAREMGMYLSTAHCALGFLALNQGELQRAEDIFNEALLLVQDANFQSLHPLYLAGFASLSVIKGKFENAVRLYGFCHRYIDFSNEQAALIKKIDLDHFLAVCQTQVERAIFERAWSEGREMTLAQAEACTQIP